MTILLAIWLLFTPPQMCREIDTTREVGSVTAGDEVLLVDNEIWSGTFDDVVCRVEGWREDGLLLLRPQSQRAYYFLAESDTPSVLCMTGPWQEYTVAVANLHTVKVLKRQ